MKLRSKEFFSIKEASCVIYKDYLRNTYNLQKFCKNNIVLILYEKLNQANRFRLVEFKDELIVTGRRTQLGYASSTNLLLSARGNCFAGSNVPLYVHNGLIYLFLSYAVSMYAASTNFDTIAYCMCSDNSYLKITLQSNDSHNIGKLQSSSQQKLPVQIRTLTQ